MFRYQLFTVNSAVNSNCSSNMAQLLSAVRTVKLLNTLLLVFLVHLQSKILLFKNNLNYLLIIYDIKRYYRLSELSLNKQQISAYSYQGC